MINRQIQEEFFECLKEYPIVSHRVLVKSGKPLL